MKISIGYRIQSGAFGGGNQFAQVLTRYLKDHGLTVCHDLNDDDIDIILLTEPDRNLASSAYDHHDIMAYLRWKNPHAIVVQRFNHTSETHAEKSLAFNKFRMAANRVADYSVFVSEWMLGCYRNVGYDKPSFRVIYNGGNRELWTPRTPRQPSDAPYKIVTHHWSTLPTKGHDIYMRLDALLDDPAWRKRVEFTFIGRLPEHVSFRNTRFLEPLSGKALANELQQHDIYLTASHYDSGPNHVIEGALCGLPLLYIETGGVPEYSAGFGVSFNVDNFAAQLEKIMYEYPNWAAKMPEYPFTDENTARGYLDLFRELAERRETSTANRTWTVPQPKTTAQAVDWLASLPEQLVAYVNSLQDDAQIGRFYPTKQGLTTSGAHIALPFSCLALKTLWMLNQPIAPEWIDFIKAFQASGNPLHLRWGEQAFVDPTLVEHVAWQTRRSQRLVERLFLRQRFTRVQRLLSGETKQAIATLAELGEQARVPYRGFPTTSQSIQRYLERLDWNQPWASGAHVATVAVFIVQEAPRFLPAQQVETLLNTCRAFVANLADNRTGAYFMGQAPPYDELVNGAMKILTALDWLEVPVHYPEKLIDTVLSGTPTTEGCHLVDAIYVLYRCQQQTEHRQADQEEFLLRMVQQLTDHFNPLDGGFSYHVGRNQTHIHGVRIAKPQPISDLHGTVLLTWASAMILHMLDANKEWRIIKP